MKGIYKKDYQYYDVVVTYICVFVIFGCFNTSSDITTVFKLHFLKIAEEVKATQPPHLKTLVGGKQGNAPCKILLVQESPFLF